jgi:hypothetical protein
MWMSLLLAEKHLFTNIVLERKKERKAVISIIDNKLVMV